nr:PREDICTED: uncharacterized protein LOC103542387 [Equus przewalskii]
MAAAGICFEAVCILSIDTKEPKLAKHFLSTLRLRAPQSLPACDSCPELALVPPCVLGSLSFEPDWSVRGCLPSLSSVPFLLRPEEEGMLWALTVLLAFLAPATQVSSNLEGTQMSVTRQAGSSAVITCDIKQSNNYVHWYRYQEGTAPQRLLYYQLSSSKFVMDSGFSSQKYHAYAGTGKTCELLIKILEESDSGVYYCAVWEKHSDSDLLYPAQKILLVAAESSLDTQGRPVPASLSALTSPCSEQR